MTLIIKDARYTPKSRWIQHLKSLIRHDKNVSNNRIDNRLKKIKAYMDIPTLTGGVK